MNSMTGFGSQNISIRDTNYAIEIKTLNSKGLDFQMKSPSLFRNLEIQIKSIIQKNLERGKIELNINSKDGKKGFIGIDEAQFVQHYEFLSKLSTKVHANSDVFSLAVQNYTSLSDTEELSEIEVNLILNTIEYICKSVNQYRLKEGDTIKKDLKLWIDQIAENKTKIAHIEPQRAETRREKLLSGLKELSQANEVDYNRLGQEMIYYIEKLDVSEELSRLAHHIQLFNSTMNENEYSGKKLGFIAQELGREINTIGSKANDSEIQHLVVDMKDQLEKIKEQLNNVV